VLLVRRPSNLVPVDRELVAKRRSYGLEHSRDGTGDLRSDTVAGQCDYFDVGHQ